jgi:5-(carboxyamino)imidazole ribonucleotide mutase
VAARTSARAKTRRPAQKKAARRTTRAPRKHASTVASTKPRVAILMGSKNDWPVMEAAGDALDALGITWEAKVISAHRTPARHHAYVTTAERRGIELFICGAGFAAHLAGVTAALTHLPVLGVPLGSSDLDGLDALLSTVQMPGGIPVATFTIGKAGAKNAGLFAGAMLAGADAGVRKRLLDFRKKQTDGVPDSPL